MGDDRAAAARVSTGWQVWGIPLHLDTSWVVVAVLVAWSLATGYFPSASPGLPPVVYWGMGVAAAVLLFGCILLHELGHSLAAKGFGIPVLRVTLFIFGGVAHLGRDPATPVVELAVALAGPLVSLLIGGVCWAVSGALPVSTPLAEVAVVIVRYLAIVNFALIVFNLLPGFPLDGGRILRAVMWALTGRLQVATRVAAWIGVWIGIGLVALGVLSLVTKIGGAGGFWYIVLGWYLGTAALAAVRSAGPS